MNGILTKSWGCGGRTIARRGWGWVKHVWKPRWKCLGRCCQRQRNYIQPLGSLVASVSVYHISPTRLNWGVRGGKCGHCLGRGTGAGSGHRTVFQGCESFGVRVVYMRRVYFGEALTESFVRYTVVRVFDALLVMRVCESLTFSESCLRCEGLRVSESFWPE